ncbi:hypothetical protein AVEN_179052-1 [Araneus ventricosus]|uniref:Uncharacterized protein n=1 Tax=Araneus ventricosus TaxID=182803 RepID=A0A4Y2PK98_ARAVE|nr:hypothetical protein AVEN_179052-1 [Araneus ventricosus]
MTLCEEAPQEASFQKMKESTVVRSVCDLGQGKKLVTTSAPSCGWSYNLPKAASQNLEPEDDSDVTGCNSPADADPGCPPLMSSPQSPKTYPEKASSSSEVFPDPYVTRSGRTVRPPERLDL